jgi:hypothetical protein
VLNFHLSWVPYPACSRMPASPALQLRKVETGAGLRAYPRTRSAGRIQVSPNLSVESLAIDESVVGRSR